MTLSPRVLCTNKWSLGRQETVNARIRVAALDEPQSGLSSWLGFSFFCHKASLSRIEARQGNATRLRTAQPEPVAGQRAWCRCSFAISSKPHLSAQMSVQAKTAKCACFPGAKHLNSLE